MKPGPELDAKVAEEVMGWKLRHYKINTGKDAWSNADGIRDCDFRPSTSISAAFGVVDKMHSRERGLYLFWLGHGEGGRDLGWRAHFSCGTQVFCATPAHSICLAALKAVEVS